MSGIAVAPLGSGAIENYGALREGHAWSTMKVPVLVTLLADYRRVGETLTAQERAEAVRAIEQSDNAAAEALFARLEQLRGGFVAASEAVQRTLRRAGDMRTVINTKPKSQGFTTWGQSIWSTSAEVMLYRALARGCLLSPDDTAYVIGLMRDVTHSQRWGVGAAGYPTSTPVAFKAGWGPERAGYLVRQTAIIGSGMHGYVLSIIASPAAGTFSRGIEMVTSLAGWARRHIALGASSPPTSCTRR